MESCMFCTQCGSELPENSKFCNKCGAAQKPSVDGNFIKNEENSFQIISTSSTDNSIFNP